MENKASKNFFIAQTPVEKQEGAQKKQKEFVQGWMFFKGGYQLRKCGT
jgi:hypothetical protein